METKRAIANRFDCVNTCLTSARTQILLPLNFAWFVSKQMVSIE